MNTNGLSIQSTSPDKLPISMTILCHLKCLSRYTESINENICRGWIQFWLHFLTGSLGAFLVIYSVIPFMAYKSLPHSMLKLSDSIHWKVLIPG